jgi:hypothetical protein
MSALVAVPGDFGRAGEEEPTVSFESPSCRVLPTSLSVHSSVLDWDLSLPEVMSPGTTRGISMVSWGGV